VKLVATPPAFVGVLAALALVALAAPPAASAQGAQGAPPDARLAQEIDRRAAAAQAKVVAWRRDFHQHPELSYQETRTAKKVAEHLRALGLEVREGVGRTGVVGLLRGGRPGPVVALRADMDALPVTEQVDLPFASKVRTTYNGQDVGVMHACGHDMHVAILMGVAEVLAGMKAELPGTVKFIFQPAEEGENGAQAMIKDGVLENPAPSAIFGLHVGVFPNEVGHLSYKPEGSMAGADFYTLVVRGRQTHGALPWGGVDPIVIGSQIVMAFQTIVSRQSDLTKSPAIVSVGSFQGGVRGNIIPDSVVMLGTIRTFDEAMKRDLRARMQRAAELTAKAADSTASVSLTFTEIAAVTYNDPALTARMLPTLQRVGGAGGVSEARVTTGAEDFSYFQRRVPGFFFFLGVRPKSMDAATFPSNHSPRFFADEGALPVGVRALAHLAMDYLRGGASPGRADR
jgi:amidohydrolase